MRSPPARHGTRAPPSRRRCGALFLGFLGAWSCRAPVVADGGPPAPSGTAQADVHTTQDPDAARAPISPPADAAAATQPLATGAASPPDVHGTFDVRWRGRESGDAHDQDVYGVLALDYGVSGQDRVTARFLGRVSLDVDGQGDADSQRVFGSLQDIDGDAAVVDVYEASAEVDRPFEAPLRLRIGRQLDFATPEPAHFDGLRAESEPIGEARVVAGAFGGIPTRIYDATSIGDQIAGAWTEAEPWTGGRVRADWMYVHQDEEGGDFHDDLLGLALWQRLGPSFLLDAGYTWLESDDRDLRARATWSGADDDLTVQAAWYRLLSVQRDFAYEFDPFYATLQEYQPFDQYRLLVSKGVGDHLRIDVGGDVRRLDEASNEGQFNHDYERGYATAIVSDAAVRGLALALTADFWNSDEQDVETWGLDLTWTGEPWRLSAGSAYALYRYDLAEGVERDDVRVWYVRARHDVSAAWALDLAYEYEDDDFDDYSQVLAGATWRF